MLLHLGEGKLRDYGYGNARKALDSLFYVFPHAGVSNVVHELMSFPCKSRDRWCWGIHGCNTFNEICLKQEIDGIGDFLSEWPSKSAVSKTLKREPSSSGSAATLSSMSRIKSMSLSTATLLYLHSKNASRTKFAPGPEIWHENCTAVY